MCKNYVSTVRVVHRLQGLECPHRSQIHYNLLSNGLKRTCDKPVRHASPMTHEVLRTLVRVVDFSKELEVVAWIAVLVAFTLILRVSNIGPRTRSGFHRLHHLTWADLILKKGLLMMCIRWTKTLQYRNKTIYAPLVPARESIICPRKWVDRMLRNIPADPSEPFFLVREEGERFPLTSSQVGRLMGEWCKRAGLNPSEYTPHCLRRGGLNWAHKARITGEALMILGDWGSQAYMRYLDLDFDSRVESGVKMAKMVK